MPTDDLQEKYQAFIKNSSEGIWLCEVDTPIPTSLPPRKQIRLMYERAYLADANDAMAKMYGLKSAEELIGARLSDLLIESDPQNTAYLTAFITSGYRLSGAESHEKDVNSDHRVFRNSLVGIIEDGKLLRAWGTQQDITAQHKTDQDLRKSEERLALALKVSNMGMWEWDIASGALHWSDELKRLFGLKPKDGITFEKYQSLLHPDDRPKMRKIIKQAMKTGKEYQIEHRAVWPDGSEHWVLGRGKAILTNGKPTLMIGTSMSLDDSKRRDELEEINQKLKEHHEQLVELNHTKDEFIALASHQLRTPATAVKQYTHMLLEGYYGELTPRQRTAVATALLSNERQLTIINDLLRVAQVDAGKVTLKRARHDVVELLEKILHEQAGKFKAKEQPVNIVRPKKRVWAFIDQARMRMVLENLIDNAHKYTQASKAITIAVTQNSTATTINIRDQGIGIPKADMPRLFQKFSRLEHPQTSNISGTGLGLYWAYKIVALHGGTITVKSALKKGSVFIVTIPNTEKDPK
jgi:PAS domain S-box-containing protein